MRFQREAVEHGAAALLRCGVQGAGSVAIGVWRLAARFLPPGVWRLVVVKKSQMVADASITEDGLKPQGYGMALLTAEEIENIERKIAAAEKLTSAELKIIISKRAWFGFRKKAMRLFRKHNLHNTKERNAVLLFILEKDRQLLIYGDEGIHEKVGDAHWEGIRDAVLAEFRKGECANGIALGLHMIADSLIEYFPATENQTNEISNEIIFEK